eukprot:scaffold14820_cov118-Isochrysis_galbana.AAC.1
MQWQVVDGEQAAQLQRVETPRDSRTAVHGVVRAPCGSEVEGYLFGPDVKTAAWHLFSAFKPGDPSLPLAPISGGGRRARRADGEKKMHAEATMESLAAGDIVVLDRPSLPLEHQGVDLPPGPVTFLA